ncbi:hypothetical protein OIV83_005328 [Microbotryomycetes sp. JL201]|nr:hypothetical protein OIV83_005328 [Microbotryomycetes sp. JL201]
MNISSPVASQITSVSFSYLTSDDIKRVSVKQVVNPVMFDNLNQPTLGGMYDPAFGPLDKDGICITCGQLSYDCPGHFGHISLPAPVFHPLYMTQAFQLLRGTCTYCHHFLTTKPQVWNLFTFISIQITKLYAVDTLQITKTVAKLALLEHGLVTEAERIEELHLRAASTSAAANAGDSPAKKKGRKQAMAADGTLSDQDQGESTEEPGETEREFADRVHKLVTAFLSRHPESTRDDYKKSANVYDKRRKVIHEFLKSLNKKRCTHCGAYAHRLRKEGHTKLVEYSLVPKQQAMHRTSNIKRKSIETLTSLAQRAIGEHESGSNGVVLANGDESDVDGNDDDDVEMNGASDNEDEDRGGMDVDDDDDATEALANEKEIGGRKERQRERIITPGEVQSHLRLLFKNEREVCDKLYAPHGPLATRYPIASSSKAQVHASPDIFFMDVVSVPPSRFRPAATMGDQVFENPQNSLLNAILRQTITVRDANEAWQQAKGNPQAGQLDASGKPIADPVRLYTQLLESLINLQVTVNSMMDSTKNPMPLRQGKLPPQGVKQMLEKKEGLFRQNMMGKRVNYAARSVISPDVNIETNEIGVPPVFARKLTFPEPVTAHNVQLLRQLVINGPHVHPGASFIQDENGQLLSLDRMSEEERTAQANKLLAPESRATSRPDRPDVGIPPTRTPQINRKVYRHLQDGDIVILNRQPTLHKPSMMCHRVKVLKGEKTIRMHYANCNSYNADFDGDEMNMHFPQSLIAQAEARMIANTDNQYLVPTSGNPLRGLIQDHVVAGVWLTNKDTWFTREQYQQLIYGALRTEDNYSGEGMIKTVPPAIRKPMPMWSGKQVEDPVKVSTLLKNITPANASGLSFSCKAKVPGSAWGVHTSEEVVLVDEGDMLTGILDKSQIGASAYGLVHSVYELYGAEIAGKLLSILSRILTKFMQSRAFTCRMDDLILTAKGNADRRAMLQTVNDKGLSAALQYVGLETADRTDQETADDLRNRLEEVLRDDYKMAGLDASVESETNQVTSKLIKQCLPGGLVKPFPHNNMQTMTTSGAKGSNVNASQISCLLGQQSLEGRRVPVMVSGKTLPSFKAFETAPRAGGFVAGRFLTGIRPQEYYFHCMAGREGLIDTAVKTSRSGYLQRCLIKHLEGLRVHYDHTVRNSDQSILQFQYGEDALDVTKQKHLMQFEFAVKNADSIINKLEPKTLISRVHELEDSFWKKALKKRDEHDGRSAAPPALSEFSPSTHLGAVSENYAQAVENYIKTNPHRLLNVKKKYRKDWPAWVKPKELMTVEHFRSLMYMRYMKSLVDPGEAVGLMASQGVGEPSTQMTLNTFHFAGHGAANVTLGIPRLREIVMTASQDIKTPTMNLPILKHVSDSRLQQFCQSSTKLTLSQVVDHVTVQERLTSKSEVNNFSRQKLYTIKLHLFPRRDYEQEYSVTSEQVLSGITKAFVPLLDKAIMKEIKQNDKELKSQVGDVGKARKVSEKEVVEKADGVAGGTDEDDRVVGRDAGEEEDGDADDARRDRQARDDREYEDEEDGEDGADEQDEDDLRRQRQQTRGGMNEHDLEDAFKSDSDDNDSDSDSSEDDEGVAASKKIDRKEALARMRQLEHMSATASRYVEKITFDKDNGEWCEFELEFSSRAHKLLLVGIVESVCRSAVVTEIPGISRCFVAKAANENDAVNRSAMTEGVNLPATWSFAEGIVDLDKITTNDIGAILRTYGVEAARTSIIREMSAVFSVYGIGVDYRHLTIIADYMTSEGGYKPFNRTGLSNNSSPFLKASYETTANFVAEAALFGDFDDLGSPSANIVLGKTPVNGTGVFGVMAVAEA